MKVHELIEHLKTLNPEAEVVQPGTHGDPSPLAGISSGWYAAENTWSGEWGDHEDDEEEEGYAQRNGVEAIYLAPTC